MTENYYDPSWGKMPRPLTRRWAVGEQALLWSAAGGVMGIVRVTGVARLPVGPDDLDRYYGVEALTDLWCWDGSWMQLQSDAVLKLLAGWPRGKEFNAHHTELVTYPDEPWKNIEASDIDDCEVPDMEDMECVSEPLKGAGP